MADAGRRAVFLDRDGVLVEEDGFLVAEEDIRLVPGVAEALARLDDAGFELVVVTNQSVVARGLATEEQVLELHRAIAERVAAAGGPRLRSFYVCPHHPDADVEAYRVACDCRKPRPGLLVHAALDLALDLERSFIVGDRITDVAAGAAAGCTTVLVRSSGAYLEPPIVTIDPLDAQLQPDHVCDALSDGASWILGVA